MKKKTTTIIPEKIHILSINIFKAHMETSDGFLESPKKAESFEFGIGNEMAHNVGKKKSRCRIFLTLDACNKDGGSIGLKLDYGIEFHFKIENFQDLFKNENENKVLMDKNLAATLLAMAYSTARGIVYERTRGTFFDGILLPVIDPYEALHDKKDITTGKSIK